MPTLHGLYRVIQYSWRRPSKMKFAAQLCCHDANKAIRTIHADSYLRFAQAVAASRSTVLQRSRNHDAFAENYGRRRNWPDWCPCAECNHLGDVRGSIGFEISARNQASHAVGNDNNFLMFRFLTYA